MNRFYLQYLGHKEGCNGAHKIIAFGLKSQSESYIRLFLGSVALAFQTGSRTPSQLIHPAFYHTFHQPLTWSWGNGSPASRYVLDISRGQLFSCDPQNETVMEDTPRDCTGHDTAS